MFEFIINRFRKEPGVVKDAKLVLAEFVFGEDGRTVEASIGGELIWRLKTKDGELVVEEGTGFERAKGQEADTIQMLNPDRTVYEAKGGRRAKFTD